MPGNAELSDAVHRLGAFAAEITALLNGTAACVLELDEGNKHARGHPSAHVLPAVLALGAALDGARERFAGTGVTTIINGCSAVEVRGNGGVTVVDPTRAALHLLGAAHAGGLLAGAGSAR